MTPNEANLRHLEIANLRHLHSRLSAAGDFSAASQVYAQAQELMGSLEPPKPKRSAEEIQAEMARRREQNARTHRLLSPYYRTAIEKCLEEAMEKPRIEMQQYEVRCSGCGVYNSVEPSVWLREDYVTRCNSCQAVFDAAQKTKPATYQGRAIQPIAFEEEQFTGSLEELLRRPPALPAKVPVTPEFAKEYAAIWNDDPKPRTDLDPKKELAHALDALGDGSGHDQWGPGPVGLRLHERSGLAGKAFDLAGQSAFEALRWSNHYIDRTGRPKFIAAMRKLAPVFLELLLGDAE